MEFEDMSDPEAETLLENGVAEGVNENSATDSSDNTIEPTEDNAIEPADESEDETTSSDTSIADPVPPTIDINAVNARSQFTPESEKLEEKLRKLCDPELAAHAKQWQGEFLLSDKNSIHYRCLVGAAFSEKRRRNNEAHVKRVQTMNLQNWCDLARINRKSGQRWADNWQAVNDAPQIIIEGAIREEIDLFRPMVAEILKTILTELGGRIPTEDEIPALLVRLDPPAKSKTKPGGPKGRKSDVALTPDPTKYCKLPESVEDLEKDCPKFLASIGAKYPKEKRHGVYLSISKVAADLAVLELPPITECEVTVEYDEGTEVVTVPIGGMNLNAFPTTESATV